MSKSFLNELKSLIIEQIDLIGKRQHILHIPNSDDAYKRKPKFHLHSAAEIFIQVSGVSCMDTINDTITCSQKEMMIIPKGISHSEKVDPGKSAFKNIVIAFEKETISIHSAIEKNNSSPSVNELQQYDSEYVPDIIRYLDKVTSWYNPSFSLHNEAALNLLLTVLNLILDKIEDPVRPRQKESHKVTQCRKLIFEHLVDQQLSVIWLAKIIKCAPDYLSYIFHRETKSKLAVYINDKRIDFAKELLSESNLNIAEISQICGYRDPGYMTRQFKKRCGESPRRYRNNMN